MILIPLIFDLTILLVYLPHLLKIVFDLSVNQLILIIMKLFLNGNLHVQVVLYFSLTQVLNNALFIDPVRFGFQLTIVLKTPSIDFFHPSTIKVLFLSSLIDYLNH